MMIHPDTLSQHVKTRLADLTRQADIERLRRGETVVSTDTHRSEFRAPPRPRLSRI